MKRVILFLLLLAVLILVSTSLAFWLAAEDAPQLSDEQSCAVLVLGYSSNANGTVSKVARFRVEEGVRLYRALGCSTLAFSGAAVRNEHVEAESMAAFAGQLNVPEKEMVIEGSARST